MRLVVSRALLVAVLLAANFATGEAARTSRDTPVPALPLLTRIADIRALSQDAGARGYPVRIRGTVTHFDEVQHTTLIVHDGAFGQFVADPAESVDSWASGPS